VDLRTTRDELVFTETEVTVTGTITVAKTDDLVVPGSDVVTVLDLSSSMEDLVVPKGDQQEAMSRLDLMAESLRGMIRNMKAEDRFGLVGFDTKAHELIELDYMSPEFKEMCLALLDQHNQDEYILHGQGQTDLSAGILKGLEILAANRNGRKRATVLIACDGAANRGIRIPEELAAAIEDFKAANLDDVQVTLVMIGVGKDHDPDILDHLSEACGKRDRYYALNGVQNDDELSAMAFTFATAHQKDTIDIAPITVRVDCAPGVEIYSSYPDLEHKGCDFRPLRRTDSMAEFCVEEMNQESVIKVHLELLLSELPREDPAFPVLDITISGGHPLRLDRRETLRVARIQAPRRPTAKQVEADEQFKLDATRFDVARQMSTIFQDLTDGMTTQELRDYAISRLQQIQEAANQSMRDVSPSAALSSQQLRLDKVFSDAKAMIGDIASSEMGKTRKRIEAYLKSIAISVYNQQAVLHSFVMAGVQEISTLAAAVQNLTFNEASQHVLSLLRTNMARELQTVIREGIVTERVKKLETDTRSRTSPAGRRASLRVSRRFSRRSSRFSMLQADTDPTDMQDSTRLHERPSSQQSEVHMPEENPGIISRLRKWWNAAPQVSG
ncbi:Predicted protein, partial [Durusdinium trenchii]